MASELSLLVPDFRKRYVQALEATKARGFRLDPMITLISPTEQASLWRQGRTAVDAELKVLALINNKAPFLAECLRKTKAKETNRVTDDLPGNSWFQWGEAATVVWIDSTSKIVLSPEWKERQTNTNGYKVLAEEVIKLGLFLGPGYNIIQLRKPYNPIDVYSLEEIDKEMKRRFQR